MQPGVGVREEEVEQECRLEELRKIRGSQGVGNAGEREGGGRRLGEGVAKSSISVRTMAGGGRFLTQSAFSGQIALTINRVSP